MAVFPLIVWLGGVILYALFILWYHNWRGALRPNEIEALLKRLDDNPTATPERKAVFEKFMREDKGREFLMLNLIQFPKDKVAHPDTGEMMRGADLLQDYFRPFMWQILRRAGHPAYQGLIKAGYVEDWGVEPNPGWQVCGLIRYRSRRDIMELVVNPAFSAIHGYKQKALLATLAMPVEKMNGFMLSPTIWVGLLLLSVCSLLHLLYFAA